MKTLNELRIEVGKWSFENFGVNRSKANDPTMVLGSLAPLMGMAEEIGELEEATTYADLEDAVGDIVIYMCDYLYREDSKFPIDKYIFEEVIPSHDDKMRGIRINLGKLWHCTLKRHQGIRGMDDDLAYQIEKDRCVLGIIHHLYHFVRIHLARDTNYTLFHIANKTWDEVVKKRDWKKDAQDGGGHDHMSMSDLATREACIPNEYPQKVTSWSEDNNYETGLDLAKEQGDEMDRRLNGDTSSKKDHSKEDPCNDARMNINWQNTQFIHEDGDEMDGGLYGEEIK